MTLDDEGAATRAAVQGTTRKLRRLWLISGIAFAVLVAGGIVAAVVGGGSGKKLDSAKLEADIHTWAVKKEKADPSVKVTCPSDEPMKAGTTFHCILSGGGQSVRLVVSVENDKGYVTWAIG